MSATKEDLKDLKLHEKLELFKKDAEEAFVMRVPDGLWYVHVLKSTREISAIGSTSIFVPDLKEE